MNQIEESGVTACAKVGRRYTQLIRLCIHRTSIALLASVCFSAAGLLHSKLLVTEVDTHTVPLCGARAEDLNRHLKNHRNKRKKHRKSSAKRAREKGRSRKK